LFGGPPRGPDDKIEHRHMDVARSIQLVTEEIMLRLARHAREVTGSRNLCAGRRRGAQLRGQRIDPRENGSSTGSGSSPPPAMREARWARPWPRGIAPGRAGRDRRPWRCHAVDACSGRNFPTRKLKRRARQWRGFSKTGRIGAAGFAVELLKAEKVVGWFQGRMEFGPRALGNRSILGDARSPQMQSVMNLKVKFRESFRPFAPIVRRERVADYFELDADSPYMLLVAPVKIGIAQAAAVQS
jgi:carbamoyltransferase